MIRDRTKKERKADKKERNEKKGKQVQDKDKGKARGMTVKKTGKKRKAPAVWNTGKSVVRKSDVDRRVVRSRMEIRQLHKES
jgi:hypothetical protein